MAGDDRDTLHPVGHGSGGNEEGGPPRMSEIPSQPQQPLHPRKKAIVVGASSGIGAALARRLAAAGHDLGLVSRRLPELERLAQEIREQHGVHVVVFQHDVKQTDEALPALEQLTRQLEGLDLLVYNAGVMYPQDPDRFSVAEDLDTMRVNLLGAVAWLLPAAERFERAGEGQIVGIGSIAGERGRRAMPAYAASKAGLHTYLEALRNRVDRAGVTVTTIKPGQVRTAMLENAAAIRGPIEPERAAELAWRAIRAGKQVAFVPSRWSLIALIIRNIPSFIFRRLNL